MEITGPYALWKTAGPARFAITDSGLTFATNGDRGVLIQFDTPVRGLDPLGILRHPELTVTVADVDGLADRQRTHRGRPRRRWLRRSRRPHKANLRRDVENQVLTAPDGVDGLGYTAARAPPAK